MNNEYLRKRNDEIARLYAEGDLTLREIGERFNLSHERVRQVLERAGIRRRVRGRPRVPREDVRERNAEIIRLYAKGLKRKEIAARVGLSQTGVDYVVRTAGVNRRRPGTGGRKKGIPLAPVEYRRKRNQEIIRLYLEEGLSCREIGTRFGLTRRGVEDILHAAGVSRRSSGWRSSWPWKDAEERRREIVDAYVEKGLSIDKVAALFGINRITVAGVLEKAGVPRPRRK